MDVIFTLNLGLTNIVIGGLHYIPIYNYTDHRITIPNQREDFLFLFIYASKCIQYIDLIVSLNFNYSRARKLFLATSSPFFYRPVHLLT